MTVFLTGKANPDVESLVGSDKTLFWEYRSKDIKGLKRKQIRELRALHEEYKFEFAICHRYKPTFIACHLPQVQVYGVAHAYGVFQSFWRKVFTYRHQKKLTLFGVSNAIRDNIRSALPWFPSEKVLTQYNHIDINKYTREQLSRESSRKFLGLPEDKYIIGNVGRLHPDKDQATLLKAFSELKMPDSLLVVVGQGRLERSLKALAYELGVSERVLFLGRVENAWKYFKAFDVFALSSDNEPFGMVLLEAIAAGIPVLSTNGGGAAEIVDENRQFAIGDYRSLAKLIVEMRSAESDQASQKIQSRFTDDGAKCHFRHVLDR
nr:glycosyltransferase [Aestuariicella albida]